MIPRKSKQDGYDKCQCFCSTVCSRRLDLLHEATYNVNSSRLLGHMNEYISATVTI